MNTTAIPASLSMPGDQSARTNAAGGLAAAIVFREILKPLGAGLGPVGEMAIASVADAMFVRPKP